MTKEYNLTDRHLLSFYLGKCEALIRFKNNSYLLDSKPTNLMYTDLESISHYEDGYKEGMKQCLRDNYNLYNAALTIFEMAMKPYHDEITYLTLGDVDDIPNTQREVRTTSSTGGQKGIKPERYSLIPVEAMDIMAELYGFGAEKYAAHNWRKGYEWSKSFDSLFRHATRAMAGEDIDEETGLPHLAGAAFHCFTLMVFMQEHPEFDDRYKKD